MLCPKTSFTPAALALITLLGLGVPTAAAQTPPPGRATASLPPASPMPLAGRVDADSPDAQRTREQFNELLQKYPPAVGRVLKLDPSLLNNDGYLAPYPALIGFLLQHPDVRRNPAYFLEQVSVSTGYSPNVNDHLSQTLRFWQDIMGGLAGITVTVVILSALGWLVRTLVDYRRWHRLSKVQADAHTKLLDRLTSNDELLAYVQSPAGSRFLQSAPIALDAGGRHLGAPFGRILWSIQAGLVLAAGGFGLQYVSGRIADEAAQPIFAMGVLAVALGVGFVLSALVSFFISRRLGLIDATAKAIDGEK